MRVTIRAMKKPEQLVWLGLDREFGNDWIAQRHEDKYSVGIPDVSFVYGVHGGWIELKAAAAGERLKIRPEQINWMARRVTRGQPCILLARRGTDWAGALVDNATAELLREPTNFDRLAALGAFNTSARRVVDRCLEQYSGIQ